MPVKESVFSKSDLSNGLAASGLRRGDIVLVQLSLANLGEMDCAASTLEASEQILSTLLDLIGRDGTLLVPTFTLSFDRYEEFDPQLTSAVAGAWAETVEFAELVRRNPQAVRSDDPLYSVVGLGPFATQILSDIP